ncbi:MAG: hypothetical protein FWC83_02040 [Alphaproteobacteria bacterium]|nr:hypothetical protein [Alphaproteobacteria bacterium]
MSERIECIANRLKLSPYQSYILLLNKHKYKLDGLQKRGEVLYAPHHCNAAHDTKDLFAKVLTGPRADLIGSERMLVVGQRGIKLYDTGYYRAADMHGNQYYGDANGAPINKSLFENLLGL